MLHDYVFINPECVRNHAKWIRTHKIHGKLFWHFHNVFWHILFFTVFRADFWLSTICNLKNSGLVFHFYFWHWFQFLSSDKSDGWLLIIKREETDENGSESIGLKTTNLRLGNSGLTLLQFKHKRSDTHFLLNVYMQRRYIIYWIYNMYKIKSAPVRYSRK